jgi:hypothetical protein
MQPFSSVELREQFVGFCSAYVLLLGWLLLALPMRWFLRIVQVAFGDTYRVSPERLGGWTLPCEGGCP